MNNSKTNKSSDGIKRIPVYATSRILKDGSIVEMVYDKEEESTAFMVCKDGKTEKKLDIVLKEEKDIDTGEKTIVTLYPFPPYNDMVVNEFIHFPSRELGYKDNLELFTKIKELINKYVVIPDGFSTIAAVYVMMTWVFDRFQTLPYLRVVGMHGTGKTRFLSVAGNLCYQSMIAGGSVSLSALFRTLDNVKGTFVFDEADFQSSEMWNEIIKILNGGHTVGFPVLRTEQVFKGKFQTKTFKVYGPKILGSRERFSDPALESRCLTQELFPIKDSSVPIHLPKSFGAEARYLRNQLLAFRFKHYDAVQEDESTLPSVQFPRLKQSALALTSVANLIDKDVLKEVKNWLKAYEIELGTDYINDPKADVLKCIIDLLESNDFIKSMCIGKLTMQNIANKFNAELYEDYTDKETKSYDSQYKGPLTIPAYKVSPRKIGNYVRKLNIRVRRGSIGYYIPIAEEYWKIRLLATRYSLDKMMWMPDELRPTPSDDKQDASNTGVPQENPDGDSTDAATKKEETNEDDERPF